MSLPVATMRVFRVGCVVPGLPLPSLLVLQQMTVKPQPYYFVRSAVASMVKVVLYNSIVRPMMEDRRSAQHCHHPTARLP